MIRSAMFIDFDNFFSGLIDADPMAALAVVERPSIWLRRFAKSHTDGSDRRWLVLRCYMDPSGSIPDPRKQGHRLYFSKLRPYFTQAGIEVVDCPRLTRGAKNAADIRIVIDVMTSMQTRTTYDEFVIASSDADFTPLLQTLRADDRRVTVVATSSTSVAYESLADRFLDEQDMFELCGPEPLAEVDEDELQLVSDPQSLPVQQTTDNGTPEFIAFAEAVQQAYQDAETPINLAQLSSQLIKELGDGLISSHWFGAGSFVRALHRLPLKGAKFSTHHLWDTKRHEAPSLQKPHETLPSVISRFREVTNLPAIPSEQWATVYGTLETYAALHNFNFTEATKWSRDHAAEQGVEIPRQVFSYVVRRCRTGGVPFDSALSPTAAGIGNALLTGIMEQATAAGLEPTEDDERILKEWLEIKDLSG